TAICNPPCQQGGKCVSPNVCECPVEAQGNACQQMLSLEAPDMSTFTTALYNIRRDDDKELYKYSTDAFEQNGTFFGEVWSKEKDYNYFNIELEGLFGEPQVEDFPSYVGNFSFGVVSATVNLLLTKTPRQDGDPTVTALDESYNCSNKDYSSTAVSINYPVTGVLKCSITNPEFSTLINHGDNFTVTATLKSGGFRDLINRNDDSYHSRQYYEGLTTSKTLLFQFDFRKPYHCKQNGTCADLPLEIANDVTKGMLQFRWSGWKDDLSYVYRYTWEVHKLEPDRTSDQNLVEPEPMRPINHTEILAEYYADGSFISYTPPEPGVYSLILEVADKANNSVFARQIFIFDPESNVSINVDTKMVISSANPRTDYLWQNNIQKENSTGAPVVVTWKNHFENRMHKENKFLNKVNTYPQAVLETGYSSRPTRVVKSVAQEFDDKNSLRTIDKVQNNNGIVQFNVAFKIDNEGGISIQIPPDDNEFLEITDPLLDHHSIIATRKDGDTMHIWVKARDIMGNENMDDMILHFDSSPPTVNNVTLDRNQKNGTFPFSSRINVDAFDEHSGIHKVAWRVIASNDSILHTGETLILEEKNCTNSSVMDCSCTPMGMCYKRNNSFQFNNCFLAIDKTNISNEHLVLELDVYNRAMLFDTFEQQNFNVFSDTGVTNIQIVARTSTTIGLTWDIEPSCYMYEVTGMTLVYRSSNGQSKSVTIPLEFDSYTIHGLESGSNYTIEIFSLYDSGRSERYVISAKTETDDGAIPIALVAGASGSAMVVLVVILVVVIILMRTGRMNEAKQKAKKRLTQYIVRPITTYNMRFNRRTGVYSGSLDDDIYALGNIILENDETYLVSFDDVALQEKIKIGHFADIYTAKFENKTVVAKLLKSGYSEQDSVVMRAKINFFAQEQLEHENVLAFLGAVLNHPQFGAYLLLEYCEEGSLLRWLKKHRGKVNEDLIEKMCNMCFGIAKGMAYLESEDVVHKRLGARNIFLMSDLEPKVAGFGPTPQLQENEDPNSTGKERIPVKWTAIECLVDPENATSASDVWSFGILIWEMFSIGDEPYPGIRNKQVVSKVKGGYRMKRPEYCPES
ncbi:hypothetical protein FSP39_011356, partial [Pinctada imbricata]